MTSSFSAFARSDTRVEKVETISASLVVANYLRELSEFGPQHIRLQLHLIGPCLSHSTLH